MEEPVIPQQPTLSRRRNTRSHHAIKAECLPLDQAAKIELATQPSKTPVSILQELLNRRGLAPPKYQLVQIEGAIHEPIFRYRVNVEGLIAMGTGRSKKEAKHAAAKGLLDLLIANQYMDRLFKEGVVIANEEPIPEEIKSDDKIGNPIGWVQEMCMSRRWPPPLYELENEEGLPHERQFTIACEIFKHREIGAGKSKKLAKRKAALKMWQYLQELPMEGNNLPQGIDEDDEISQKVTNVASRYADLKDSKISTLSTSHSHKVSNFHKNLKQSSGPKLAELQKTSLNNQEFNFVQFLQEIASEQQFEVTYVDIEEKSLTGKSQCLVQLSTLPVAVCYGSGTTSKDAQSSAAQNALEYLKIMTKK